MWVAYMIGVYYETWACPWTDKAEECELAKIDVPVTHIFLSFCRPDCTYKKSQGTWKGTGLEFSSDFQVIRQAIQIVKKKGIKVILSIGGANGIWGGWNSLGIALLCYDLELDGFDIDYEPQDYFDAAFLSKVIKTMKSYCVSGQSLSLAGFAGGCLTPVEQPYRGTLTPVLDECYPLLDFVNIMNYDAGKDWDYVAAYKSYQKYPITVGWGLQVGHQGWGDAYLTAADVQQFLQHIEQPDFFFIWAWFKAGTPNCREVIRLISPEKEQGVIYCKNCGEPVCEIIIK